MNILKLSGILEDDPIEQMTPYTHVTFVTAHLRFNSSGGVILVMAVNARARADLSRFVKGDALACSGSLLLRNNNFVFRVDECEAASFRLFGGKPGRFTTPNPKKAA